jgi:ABC-type tungstate transport system permease subunit
MKYKVIPILLFLGAFVFFGLGVANAAEEKVDHKAEAIKHTEQAVEQGKQGHADVLVEHAQQALKHAKEGTGVRSTYELEVASPHLRQAIEQGKQGHVDVATKHAEEALAKLTTKMVKDPTQP